MTVLAQDTKADAPAPTAAPTTSGYHKDAIWKLGGLGGWDYLSLDADGHRLYVARQDRVQVVDTEKGTVIGEVPGLDGAHGVALAPEFNRGFASSGKSSTVIIFDLTTLKPIGNPVSVGKGPDAIIYEPVTKHVIAFNGHSEDASVIDAASGSVVGTIPLGGSPEFAAVDGKGKVFVNLEDKSEVLVIDARGDTVTGRWPLAPGEAPTGLAFDAAKQRLFAGCHNQEMVVLDAGTGKLLAELPIGKGVDAGAFDPATGFAFASNGDGTLTVVQEDTDKPGAFHVVENVTTQKGARTMALDLKTHAIYLAAADFEAAPAPSPGEKPQRPKMVPGTFVILKFVR